MAVKRKWPAKRDYREYILADSPVITEESWELRNELEARHYPQIMPLLSFGDDHLLDILIDVEQPTRPSREFPIGAPDDPKPVAYLSRRSWLEWSLFRGVAPDARRPAIPAWIKRRVIERDGMVCQLCHLTVEAGDMHLDHIKPFSLGGATDVNNLQVTHSTCNMRKGAKWLADTLA